MENEILENLRTILKISEWEEGERGEKTFESKLRRINEIAWESIQEIKKETQVKAAMKNFDTVLGWLDKPRKELSI